jgi:hypothetical protein
MAQARDVLVMSRSLKVEAVLLQMKSADDADAAS